MQEPFSQDSLSHTSFLLQDLSHVSFKNTHTCKILSHKTLSHTHHFYCKIFLTCLLKNTLTLQDPFSQDSHTFLLQDFSHMSFKNTLTLQDPFSQDSHTSFLLQDLSHMSFKKHTHTARSFLTRLTHIISTARSFSQDSIFNADSHIPAARPFLTRLSHTHSQYKIFLTRQSHSFIKAARPILT